MSAIRRYCCNRIIGLRLMVILVAVYTLIPSQLVWCHDHGESPSMKAALNGRCLTGGGYRCCGSNNGNTTPDLDALTEEQDHFNCVGCTDNVAHVQYETRVTRCLKIRNDIVPGGEIYALQAMDVKSRDHLTGNGIRLSPWSNSSGLLHNNIQILLI